MDACGGDSNDDAVDEFDDDDDDDACGGDSGIELIDALDSVFVGVTDWILVFMWCVLGENDAELRLNAVW